MEVSLEVLAGKQKGRRIPLPATLFVIGRDPLCHLRPHSALVSRRHCAIARWGDKLLLRDLKSANGTFVNNERLEGQSLVHDGDVLRIGDLSFAFHIHVAADEVRAPDAALSEQAIRWLIEDPGDSAVLDPGLSTAMGQVMEPERKTVTAGAGGSKALSAGKYFRDYFKQKKKGK